MPFLRSRRTPTLRRSGGGKIELLYTEAIGLSHFLYGGFERAELQFVQDFLSEGQRAYRRRERMCATSRFRSG